MNIKISNGEVEMSSEQTRRTLKQALMLYKSDNPTAVIANWMRNWDTLEFLGLWESLHNSDFNLLEFEGVRREVGGNGDRLILR